MIQLVVSYSTLFHFNCGALAFCHQMQFELGKLWPHRRVGFPCRGDHEFLFVSASIEMKSIRGAHRLCGPMHAVREILCRRCWKVGYLLGFVRKKIGTARLTTNEQAC